MRSENIAKIALNAVRLPKFVVSLLIELFSFVHCRCIVPTVRVSTPMLSLGRCFLQHPYRCHVELSNDTDLPAKYELLPGSAVDSLDSVMYTSPQPEVCMTARGLYDSPRSVSRPEVCMIARGLYDSPRSVSRPEVCITAQGLYDSPRSV